MILKPNVDKIIVRVKTMEEVTSGGIIIPDKVRDSNPPIEGTVLAIGRDISDYVSAGDCVVFGKYAAHLIPDGNMENKRKNDLYVITEGDILYKKENI